MSEVGVVDAFVNPVLWDDDQIPDYAREAAADVFGGTAELRSRTLPELVAEMDAAGVGRAVLNAVDGKLDEVAAFVAARPDRFLLSAEVDPRCGMQAVRFVEQAVRNHDLRLIRMTPFATGLPPNDRAYYPVYAKCVELGVAVSMTTGIPGPPLPAELQRPLHLDDVCRFFRELVVIMAHGAAPWWAEAVHLLGKYPNLYMMTSAWAPKYLPAELLAFMGGTRGRRKVMFATDYPMLGFERCVREARELPLPSESLAAYLGGNALDVLDGTREPLRSFTR